MCTGTAYVMFRKMMLDLIDLSASILKFQENLLKLSITSLRWKDILPNDFFPFKKIKNKSKNNVVWQLRTFSTYVAIIICSGIQMRISK